jgi:hypothetical protein
MYMLKLLYLKPKLMRTIQYVLPVLLCAMLGSCTSINKKKPAEAIIGNWLIIFPDHQLKTAREREVYGRYQDSVVSLFSLKLITLSPDGTFTEIDSMQSQRGRLTFTNDSLLRIQEGGKGFNPFTAAFKSFENDTLQLVQYLPLEGEKIKLVWHLKKIENGNESAALFSPLQNNWRSQPAAPESEAVMRQRLAGILHYYAGYFALISKEATYFIPARVPLPLHFYQHGMGLNAELSPAFKALFYNDADAKKAYSILQQAMRKTDLTSTGDNYVIEYGAFLKKMAEAIEK